MDNREKIARFRTMAEADPTNELAHLSLGKLCFEAGEHVAAAAALRRTLELSPEHAQAHRLLGEVLLRLGERQEAIRILSEGVILAHRRGEFQPRDQMTSLLAAQGAPIPQLATASPPSATAATAGFVCSRCRRANLPLSKQPFRSELGRKVLEHVCESCWREWTAMGIKVINEYRLNLASAEGNEVYETHLKEFLGLN